MNNVTIIGLDTLGGSIGLAIKKSNPEVIITGVDKASVIVRAKNIGAIDNGCLYNELNVGVKNADLVILATSIRGIQDLIPKITQHLKKGAIVTDTGMTKRQICEVAKDSIGKDATFIGGHPLVGFKRGGIEVSNPYIFSNNPYILTPLRKSTSELNDLKKLIGEIGAKVFVMDPDMHDKLMGEINSVLQVIAIAHTNSIFTDLDEKYIDIATVLGGERFKNFSQPLLMEPYYWEEVFKSNEDVIKNHIKKLEKILDNVIESLDSDNIDAFYTMYKKAKDYISKVPMYTKGFQSKLHYVYVTIKDEPGSIAKLTSIISEGGFDIRDIEVVKIKENEAVLIKLAFRSQSIASKVGKILMEKGYKYNMYISYDLDGIY